MLRRLAVSAALLAAIVVIPHRVAPIRAAGAANVSFSLNWIRNVEFGGIWVAQQKGWWKAAGLNVTTLPIAEGSDPTVLVGAGKYTFGFQDGASLIIARAHGVPVKAVWASGQRSPFAFITLPKSGITGVKDFRGKRIGYQGHEEYVLQAMLSHAGMTLRDVKPVVVGYDPSLLLAGRVDAYLSYLTNEPIELAEKNHVKVNIIKASDYGYDFYNDVLFTTDSTIQSQPALVRKVVGVMDRGWRYAIAHPAEVARIVVPRLDSQDSLTQQITEMRELAPLSSGPGATVGSMSVARWQNGISLLLKYKQIPSAVSPGSVFTTQFLPR